MGSHAQSLDAIPSIESLLRTWIVSERRSYSSISEQLKQQYPNIRGLSVRSIKRFCSSKEIYVRSKLTDIQIDRIVECTVRKVGPSYGRKTIAGLLASDGIRVAESRVGKSLSRVSPEYHFQRSTHAHAQINPIPYKADYFGQKLHVDQNEKLIMFGCTHICAVDGRSGMIVGFTSMAIKNNILIYEHMFKKLLVEFGIWDQIRVDHGKEWYLMLSAQQSLSHLRRNRTKPCFVQTSSKKNHIVERMWVEVNTRINYPLKKVLIHMMESNDFNLDDELHFFCVSTLTRRVTETGIRLFISAWNHHRIPSKRCQSSHVPVVEMRLNNRVGVVPSAVIPSSMQAVTEYTQSGGHLTDPQNSFIDPLEGDQLKQNIRESTFSEHFPSIDCIFYATVNNDSSLFIRALKFYIDITFRLVNS